MSGTECDLEMVAQGVPPQKYPQAHHLCEMRQKKKIESHKL